MAEFLADPSVLTKDKLKTELAANNVPLPSGDHKKEVYVQLYLKNLTVLNSKNSASTDTFSSDEELPAPVVTNRSRSGRKATKKTDKPRTEEVELTELTDEDLRQQLAAHGVDSGPIVASTRKVYEQKLQKLMEQPAAEPEAPTAVTALPKADSNGNSDHYSDKEDEVVAAPEPEPVPVVEKAVRSRGKTPVTVRTSSRRQTKQVVEEVVVVEETPKKASKSIVEDILANEISTPTGISATCRRPIRGAAGRPIKPSEYWMTESPVQRSVHTESRSYSESLARPSVADTLGKPKTGRGFLSVLLKLLLLVVVCVSLYYAYENVDADQIGALKGVVNNVVVPVQGFVDNAVAYLGITAETADFRSFGPWRRTGSLYCAHIAHIT